VSELSDSVTFEARVELVGGGDAALRYGEGFGQLERRALSLEQEGKSMTAVEAVLRPEAVSRGERSAAVLAAGAREAVIEKAKADLAGFDDPDLRGLRSACSGRGPG
jgi:hypothetical protein